MEGKQDMPKQAHRTALGQIKRQQPAHKQHSLPDRNYSGTGKTLRQRTDQHQIPGGQEQCCCQYERTPQVGKAKIL
ncbi:hypothetical protein D3C80_1442180 [compost metagenome]